MATPPNAIGALGEMILAIPPGVDFLLPGSAAHLAYMLPAYRPDLLLVCGFNWKIPASVIQLPRLGALNIHPSMLPRHRGPEPIAWAIRNGETHFGITVHRMDAELDSGNIIAQQGGIPIDEDPSPDRLWIRMEPIILDLLTDALDRVSHGYPGEPQDTNLASYEGIMDERFFHIDWQDTSRSIHNLVRAFRAKAPGQGPLARIDGRWLKILHTEMAPGNGLRVECADGPIWITEYVAAQPPNTDGAI
ncbi:methionyl-tRNA formyltransferase [Nocardia brasiliensis]|uniref:methionyl-tRNA formyltransferase n=1 Tax=Nocardia brasiliensis TaxID=37326 RepID=UPI002458F85F|nr:formyltransferase family protein [Nocardia brasiliensis]